MNLDAVYYRLIYGGVMGTTNCNEHRILVEDRTDASHYDSTELFAEAFWRFYTDNATLAANCPKLYALMSRVCPAPDN